MRISRSEQNFAGEVVFDGTGPMLVGNGAFKGILPWSYGWEDGLEDPQQPGVNYEDIFPESVRVYSESDMHAWKNGSMKLRQVS